MCTQQLVDFDKQYTLCTPTSTPRCTSNLKHSSFTADWSSDQSVSSRLSHLFSIVPISLRISLCHVCSSARFRSIGNVKFTLLYRSERTASMFHNVSNYWTGGSLVLRLRYCMFIEFSYERWVDRPHPCFGRYSLQRKTLRRRRSFC